MNNLEGYTTNGYEYRKAEIDRNNAKRLKWMMKQANDNLHMQDNVDNEKDENINDNNRNKVFEENKETKASTLKDNMFNPNINRFAKFNNNNFK